MRSAIQSRPAIRPQAAIPATRNPVASRNPATRNRAASRNSCDPQSRRDPATQQKRDGPHAGAGGWRGHAAAAFAMVVLAMPALALADSGDVRIEQPRAREAPPGARTAAIYLRIDNRGAVADRLLAARSPRAATVELHAMSMDGGIMRMRAVPDVPIPAHGRVELAPGGLHLMLVDPAPALRAGERVPLTLTFARAGAVTVDVMVEPLQGAAPHKPH